MAVAVSMPLVVVTPRLLADCCPGACSYRPWRIGKILELMDELAQGGYEPSEALMDALVRQVTPEAIEGESPYQNRSHSFGPSEPTGAQIVADIWRALRAGHRDPVAIGSFLCPRSGDSFDQEP